MHMEKFTDTPRTCTACIEKCIASFHRPFELGISSFYKVMEINSSSSLDIPTDFVKRMQLGVYKDAILQGPSGHLWHVNLCCANTKLSFTDGWESFVSDQFIEVGDILVFRHVDNVHFAVQVFEPSGCEKQCVFSFQCHTSSCSLRKGNMNLSSICKKTRCNHRQNCPAVRFSLLTDTDENIAVKGLKKHHTRASINSGQCNSLKNLPEFSVVLRNSAVTYGYRLSVPKAFADRWMRKENVETSFQVRLLYEKKYESWQVMFATYQRFRGFLSGWKAFVISNGLQEGDTCVFKLLDELPYKFEVHVIKRGLHNDRGYRRKKEM